MVRYYFIKYCPNCASRNVRRSLRRGDFERFLLPFLFIRPFRCEECDLRFLGPVFGMEGKQAARKADVPARDE